MADDFEDVIRENVTGPAKAAGDSGSIGHQALRPDCGLLPGTFDDEPISFSSLVRQLVRQTPMRVFVRTVVVLERALCPLDSLVIFLALLLGGTWIQRIINP